ncbi:MAG TPA: hypothetical protein VLY23_12975 [Candidatus Acidoferrum sp.]|nr:hypothetical protein [Candidatus Acidoferrum sp.]
MRKHPMIAGMVAAVGLALCPNSTSAQTATGSMAQAQTPAGTVAQAQGSRTPPNPGKQPQTPAEHDAALKALAAKLKMTAPRKGPKIKSTASHTDAAIIAVLQTQKHAADSEFAAMKAAPALQRQNTAGSMPPAHTESTKPGSVGPTPRGAAIAHAPTATVAAPPASGSKTSVSPLATRPANLQVPGCAISGTAMAVGTVAGVQHGATLSPDPQYNLYTIHGCNFGDPSPANKVWVYGVNGFHEDLQIQSWMDNSIAVNFAPNLGGVLDQDNVHLVVSRSDGKQVDAAGFKFYAMRQTVLLTPLPQNRASLWQGGQFSITYTAPATDLAQYSSEVARSYQTTVPGDLFGPLGVDSDKKDTDSYDLSQLAPGWSPDSFNASVWTPTPMDLCGAWDDHSHTAGNAGNWDFEWAGNGIRVTLQGAWCNDQEVFQQNYVATSQYALQVWVNGPLCVDPWTNQPLHHAVIWKPDLTMFTCQ